MAAEQFDPLAGTELHKAWESLERTLPHDVDDAVFGDHIEPLLSKTVYQLAKREPPRRSALYPDQVHLLRSLGRLVADAAHMYRTRPQNPDSEPLATALMMLNKLALQRTWGVETMLRAGLDVGAVIASRPLYETSAKAKVIRQFDGQPGSEHLAEQFLASGMVETRKNARTHERTWGQHGHPYDPDLLQQIEQVAEQAIEKARGQGNPSLAKQNGWAAPINGGNVPTLAGLATLAGIDDHQLAYTHGSHHIHANAYAAITNAEPPGGPDTYGPPEISVLGAAGGQYATLGLRRTVEALLENPQSDIEARTMAVIQHLAHRTYTAFHDADL